MNRGDADSVDVGAIVDKARFTGLPLFVIAGCAVTLILDGFDIQAIGYAAPAMVAEWGIEKSALGPVLAASLVGMALGGLTAGPIGDRFGRKPGLILCVMLFGLATLAGAWARNLTDMTVLRLIAGIGLGGALPNVTAIMSEYAPPRWRSLIVTMVIAGVPVGGLMGAIVAVWLLPIFGWQIIFILGGLMPIALAAALWIWLPESARFLVKNGTRGPELARILNRLQSEQQFRGDERFILAEPVQANANATVSALFSPGFARDTLLMWLVFFCSIFAVYAVMNWLPTMLVDAGFEPRKASSAGIYFNLGAIFGTAYASWLIAHRGSRGVLIAVSILGAIAAFAVGQLPQIIASDSSGAANYWVWMIVALLCVGASMVSLQCGMFTVTANAYPTSFRSTGIGWALGIGRLGGIASAFLGTFVLGIGWHTDAFFAIIAGVLLVAAAGLSFLRRHVMPHKA